MGLLLQGGWGSIALTSLTAVVGTGALAASFGGWGLSGASLPVRVLAGAGGALLLHPAPMADAAGVAALALAITVFCYRLTTSGGGARP